MADDKVASPPEKSSGGWTWWLIVTLIWLLFGFLYAVGAAKLSYDRSRSVMFAILAFFLSPLYYPYYAFTQPAPTVMGAARKLKGLW